ncbi:hypothetical protein LTR62_005222 [Meristemomyces frigidus]|uniref:Uncharacterized protein n=1 Tax=Meristemomyces frigidus TaxID=1508187 RepID=A0AAN7YFL6_9PEZI|nr:hypothetical protein LTR62_005222 [Meristemomyces frigidus]
MADRPAAGRITKRAATTSGRRSTRRQSKLAQASSSTGAWMLQDMVDDEVSPAIPNTDSTTAPMLETTTTEPEEPVHARSKDKGKQLDYLLFPLMKLPPECRNEIYRACVTRPYPILLSKKEERQPQPEPMKRKREVEPSHDETIIDDEDCTLVLDDEETDDARDEVLSPYRLRRAFSSGSRRARNQMQRISNANAPNTWANRSGRAVHLSPRNSTSKSSSSANVNTPANDTITFPANPSPKTDPIRPRRPQDADPLIVALLRVSKQLYQEARSILYGENHFTLDLDTAVSSLAALHQRSRRQIKFVELEIPCYNEILEHFQETVRLSLRYCWGLRFLTITMPSALPGTDGSGTTGNTIVYANGFDILRWLPRQCQVRVLGKVCKEIEAAVARNARLAKTLNELAYARRQLIANENAPAAAAV